MPFAADFKAQLDAVDPRLWFILWAGIVGGVNHALKLTPLWSKLPSALKVPFSAANGAVIGLAADTSIDPEHVSVLTVAVNAFVGSFTGLTATGGHQLVSRAKPKPSEPASAGE